MVILCRCFFRVFFTKALNTSNQLLVAAWSYMLTLFWTKSLTGFWLWWFDWRDMLPCFRCLCCTFDYTLLLYELLYVTFVPTVGPLFFIGRMPPLRLEVFTTQTDHLPHFAIPRGPALYLKELGTWWAQKNYIINVMWQRNLFFKWK